MLSASDLSAEQIEAIKAWVSGGAQMADVQKRLKDDFDLNVTYMDTRFIALDLELEFEKDEVEEEAEVVAEELPAAQDAPVVDVTPRPDGAPGVFVGIDEIAHPGSMVSGTVTFSDGEKGTWMIDEMGRPSIDPETDGYRPAQEDLEGFQIRLREIFDSQM